MKKILSLLTIPCLILLSCQDDDNECGCEGMNTTMMTSLSNKYATVIETVDGFQIFSDEEGFLSTCNELDPKLRVNGKSVILSQWQIMKSCKKIVPNFPINPVRWGSVSPYPNYKYDRLDITLKIIKSEDYGYAQGFGYILQDNRTLGAWGVVQATIPGEGDKVFDTEEKAYLTGLLDVYCVRHADSGVSKEVLQYIKVID